MRPQLLIGGLMVALLGVGFYALQLPLVYFWSVPFGIGGLLMVVAGYFMDEGPGPVQPPEGYRFCVFCSTPVKIGAERCQHCNGVQPK
ncbi:MAG TPA: hypothetical protein VFE91_06785 [Nitrososphaerales archaeon]|nr:hypothetical protein [Nitrososphaerales archaeon]